MLIELYDPLPPYISFLVSIHQISSLTVWLSVTVKSSELEWLPEGSQLSMSAPAQSGDKQKTFTSFSQSQKEILEKPLGVKFKDITIARLGPGQVAVWLVFLAPL
jgi:hypothetical protein